ncbi:sodium/glucose cotransporter 5, partial [Biomphalaria pfeifferi]
MKNSLAAGDYIALGGYFTLVLAVGAWSVCRHKSNSATGYFLAGRSMHWFP